MKRIDILLIDDEKKFALMLAKRLEVRGCTCHICFDGKSGLDWVRQNDNDVTLILLDLQLPDLYGTEVLKAIKEINTEVPVLILTGHGTETDRKECERLGAYLFLHKPLNLDQLMSTLEQFREKRGC